MEQTNNQFNQHLVIEGLTRYINTASFSRIQTLLDAVPNLRYEVIDERFYIMPSPSPRHQNAFTNIGTQLAAQVSNYNCKTFQTLDIRLFPNQPHDYVCPDIMVICNRDMLRHYLEDDTKPLEGVPGFVIEILSPSNAQHDLITKRDLYLRAQVPEYWVIDILSALPVLHRFILDAGPVSGVYRETILEAKGVIPIEIIPGCAIDFDKAFQ
ncbi:MAG: Uma2 family endonuclease [Treponema sp.]|jgi:Uma2 family endonuclease|nr:Uma2 family endonuclease [Treponema sp.]